MKTIRDSKIKTIKNSQNFLHSKLIAKQIIERSNITNKDIVLEIGTGTGILTRELCKKAQKVISIELDIELYKIAQRTIREKNLILFNQDFMNFHLPNKTKYIVFSNIPFQNTAEIMNKLIRTRNVPKEMYIFLDKDAAKKYLGKPFQKYCSLVNLILRPQFDISIEYKFRRTDFSPVPQIDIVLLHMLYKKTVEVKEYSFYKDFIVFLFIYKNQDFRKTLHLIFTNKQIRQLEKKMGKFNADFRTYDYDTIKNIFQNGIQFLDKKKIIGSYQRYLRWQKGLQKQHRNRNFL